MPKAMSFPRFGGSAGFHAQSCSINSLEDNVKSAWEPVRKQIMHFVVRAASISYFRVPLT